MPFLILFQKFFKPKYEIENESKEFTFQSLG